MITKTSEKQTIRLRAVSLSVNKLYFAKILPPHPLNKMFFIPSYISYIHSHTYTSIYTTRIYTINIYIYTQYVHVYNIMHTRLQVLWKQARINYSSGSRACSDQVRTWTAVDKSTREIDD